MITKDIPGISRSTGIYQGYPWCMPKHENLSTGIRFQMESDSERLDDQRIQVATAASAGFAASLRQVQVRALCRVSAGRTGPSGPRPGRTSGPESPVPPEPDSDFKTAHDHDIRKHPGLPQSAGYRDPLMPQTVAPMPVSDRPCKWPAVTVRVQ